MKKSFFSRMKIPFKYLKDFKFLFNVTFLENDNEILKNIFIENISTVTVSVVNNIPYFELPKYVEGKRIHVSIYLGDDPKESVCGFEVGTLEQIKELYKRNEYYFLSKGKGIIYPGGIEVKENDERTFSEIGIRDNCTCKGIIIKKPYK